MGYDKMTPSGFLEKLNNGEYSGSTGAKRALGRAGFAAKDKTRCLNAVAKYYGDEATPAAPKKASSGKKKKVAKKAKKATAKATKAAKKTARKAKPAASKPTSTRRSPQTSTRSPQTNTTAKLERLALNEKRIGTIDQAVAVMKRAKDVDPNLDLGKGPEHASSMLTAILQEMERDIGSTNGASTMSAEAIAKFAESAPAAATPMPPPAVSAAASVDAPASSPAPATES